MGNTMTNQQRLQYLKVALATLDIHFEKDKTYISILAMVDLIDAKKGNTTIDDMLYENSLYQKNYDLKQILEDKLSNLPPL
jgi:hypothetical protein